MLYGDHAGWNVTAVYSAFFYHICLYMLSCRSITRIDAQLAPMKHMLPLSSGEFLAVRGYLVIIPLLPVPKTTGLCPHHVICSIASEIRAITIAAVPNGASNLAPGLINH